MKVDSAQLKKDGISALLVTGGFMGANAVTKLVPIENPMIKSSIPLALGAAGIAFGGKNNYIKDAGKGMLAFGVLSIVRTAVMGDPTTSTEGIAGLGENATVQKIAGLLLPNLGNAGYDSVEYAYKAPEPAYQTIDPWVGAKNTMVDSPEEDKLFLGNPSESLFPELGNADFAEFENEEFSEVY
jgi:hypothetical protein